MATMGSSKSVTHRSPRTAHRPIVCIHDPDTHYLGQAPPMAPKHLMARSFGTRHMYRLATATIVDPESRSGRLGDGALSHDHERVHPSHLAAEQTPQLEVGNAKPARAQGA